MWFKITVITLLGCDYALSTDLNGIVSGNRMASVPLGRSLGKGELDVEGICTEAGTTCQNCTHAVTCISLPVGWLKVPLQQCPDGQTCNAHLRQCSPEPVPECDAATQNYRHTCEQVGIFPDAYDCRKFHLCSPPEDLPDGKPADHRVALCPRHYGYNPQTAQCSIPLNEGQCSEKPVPSCSKVGQFGALESSQNYYYVCLSRNGFLYPQIFVCPHGWYFWDNYCRPEAPTTSSTTEAVASTTEESTTQVPTTSRIEAFFSTEQSVTHAADTFLADKFDLSHYDTTYDVVPSSSDEFANSFESDTGESW